MTAQTQIAIRKLQEAVANYYSLDPAGMVGRSREQPLAFVRQLAMAVARDGCRAAAAHASDREIGVLFARDRTTVGSAAIAIRDFCAVEPATMAAYTHFLQQFTTINNMQNQ